MIQIRYSSADRDETVFEQAEAFDVTRDNARQNIAFATACTCVSAQASRAKRWRLRFECCWIA